MPDIDLYSVGSKGVNTDQPAHELDPEFWTSANNVRFSGGRILPFGGHAATKGTPLVMPRWLLPVPTALDYFWLMAGETNTPGEHKFYCIDGTTHTDVTPSLGVLIGSDDDRWNGGILNGVPFVNNGLQNPLAWIGPLSSVELTTFADWTPGHLSNMSTRVLRSFSYFLVALGITEDSVFDPYLLRWSHTAAPGTLPDSWDETDETKDAGRTVLGGSPDKLVDCLPLGRSNIIYKETSIHAMSYIGGTDVFRFEEILPDSGGLIATDCVVPVNNKRQHFAVGGDDIYIFNGQVAESIVTQRVYNNIFRLLDGDFKHRCFCAVNYKHKEVWFFFPTINSTAGWPDRIAVYNYQDNTWTFRDVGDPSTPVTSAYATSGFVTTNVARTWDTAVGTWDDDLEIWDESTDSPAQRDILMTAGDSVKELWTVDNGATYDGYTFTASWGRTGLAITGRDRFGNWKVEPYTTKLPTELFIQADGAEISARVGAAETPNGAVAWDITQSFDPGTMDKLDIVASGKYLAVEYSATGQFIMTGYTLKLAPTSRYIGAPLS